MEMIHLNQLARLIQERDSIKFSLQQFSYLYDSNKDKKTLRAISRHLDNLNSRLIEFNRICLILHIKI